MPANRLYEARQHPVMRRKPATMAVLVYGMYESTRAVRNPAPTLSAANSNNALVAPAGRSVTIRTSRCQHAYWRWASPSPLPAGSFPKRALVHNEDEYCAEHSNVERRPQS